MEVINPVGRSVADEMQADYSLSSERCKCENISIYAQGRVNVNNNHCACTNGTVEIRVNAG